MGMDSRRFVTLRKRCRTVSYTLCGDSGRARRSIRALGIRQLRPAARRRVRTAGVEQGGAVRRVVRRLHRAALRGDAPGPCDALIIASSPAPGWVPDERQQSYLAHPWLSAPPLRRDRTDADVAGDARPHTKPRRERLAFSVRHAGRVIAAPMVPSRMAARVTTPAGPRLRARLRAYRVADARHHRRGPRSTGSFRRP